MRKRVRRLRIDKDSIQNSKTRQKIGKTWGKVKRATGMRKSNNDSGLGGEEGVGEQQFKKHKESFFDDDEDDDEDDEGDDVEDGDDDGNNDDEKLEVIDV